MCAFLRLRKKKTTKKQNGTCSKGRGGGRPCAEGFPRCCEQQPQVLLNERIVHSAPVTNNFSSLCGPCLTRHSRGAPTPHTSHSGVMLGWAHGKTTHAAGKSRSLCRRSHGRGPAAEAEAKKKAKLAVTFIRELEHFSPHPNTCKRKRRTFFC